MGIKAPFNSGEPKLLYTSDDETQFNSDSSGTKVGISASTDAKVNKVSLSFKKGGSDPVDKAIFSLKKGANLDPSPKLKFAFTKIDDKDEVKDLAVKVEEVAYKASLYAQHGPGKGVTHRRMSSEQKTEYREALNAFKELVCPNATKMIIQYNEMRLIITENGVDSVGDITQLIKNDPQIAHQFEELESIVEPIWSAPLHTQFYEAGSRAPMNSPPALIRSTPAATALPKTYQDSIKLVMKLTPEAQQATAMKRILVAERVIAPIIDRISKKINERAKHKQDNLDTISKDAPNRAVVDLEIEEVLTQIMELEAQKDELEIDRTALFIALSFYPAEENATMAQVAESVKAAQKALQDHLNTQEGPQDTTFASEAARLMLSAKSAIELRGFEEDPKADRLENRLVAFVLNGETHFPEIEATINSMPDELQRGCLNDLEDAVNARSGILDGPLPRDINDWLTNKRYN